MSQKFKSPTQSFLNQYQQLNAEYLTRLMIRNKKNKQTQENTKNYNGHQKQLVQKLLLRMNKQEISDLNIIMSLAIHPKVLYGTHDLNAKIIKVFSPFEYMHYIKRRQDYQNKQQELIANLQLSKENYEKLTFSVKQIGVTDDEGRVGSQSQRKYLLKSMESTRLKKSESIQHSQTERIQYQFRSKALPSSRRQKTRMSQQQSNINFLTIPEKSETQIEFKTTAIDKIIKRSRQKKRIPLSQPQPPEVVFAKYQQNQKYLSYSRQLQELKGTLDFIKLL